MIDFHTHPLLVREMFEREPDLPRIARDVFYIRNRPQPLETFLLELAVSGLDRAVLLPIDASTTKGCQIYSNELIAEAGVTAPKSANDDWPKVTLVKVDTLAPEGDIGDPLTVNMDPDSDDAGPPVVYREEQLENILVTMCKRGGFNGAVIADHNGLPLAAYNSPVDDDIIAAFTSVSITAFVFF